MKTETPYSRKSIYSFKVNHPYLFKFLSNFIIVLGNGYVFFVSVLIPLITLLLASIFILEFRSTGHKKLFLYAFALIIIGVVVFYTFRRVFKLLQQVSVRGTKLGKNDFPELHSALNKVVGQIKSPNITRISIEPDSNISITTPIRFGRKNDHWLTVGISIFLTFSRPEFEAIMGHELGHLCGTKNKASRKLLQKLYKWKVLCDELTHKDMFCWFLAIPFRVFLLPSLQKLTDAMHWDNEWESDELSAQVFGKKPFARALLKIEIINVLQEFIFWEKVFNPSQMEPEPHYDFYARYQQFILEESQLNDWLIASRWVLTMPPAVDSMHPSTRERLERLGIDESNLEELVQQIYDTRQSTDSALNLLGIQANELIELFNKSWYNLKRDTWKNYLRVIHGRRTSYDFLSQKIKRESLTQKENIEWLMTHAEYEGDQATLPHWISFLEAHPGNETALLEVGQGLCRLDDKSGLYYLGRLIEVSQKATLKACWKLFYYREKLKVNSPDNRLEVQAKISKFFDARWEVSQINHKNIFSSLELSQNHCDYIKEYVTTFVRCKEAWVVRFHPKSMPDYPCVILFLKVSPFQQPTERQISFIIANLPVADLEHCIVFPSIIPMFRWRRVLDIPNAKIF